ncbi:MAG: hypothetical protein V5B40_13185 [Candidatus Accumulibacter meliphilus]|uniref:hypothetical protein n=1 Tax=Candidatus Accumulibacter meliphilus TaxID=2211374 RepID=UPI002FC2D16F
MRIQHARCRGRSTGRSLADHTAGLRLIQLASIVTSEAPQALSEQQRRSLIVGLL